MLIVTVSTLFATSEVNIPFELVNGLIVVKAEIDGKTDNYIVDSGSNGVLLNRNAESFATEYISLSGTVSGEEKAIDKLRVGAYEVDDISGFSIDLSNLEKFLGRPLGGILGCTVFTPHSVVFDFAQSSLRVSSEKPMLSEVQGLSQVAFSNIDGLPFIKVTIQDERYSFLLDSGASSHFVDAKLIENKFISASPTGLSKDIHTVGGVGVASQFILSGVTIGNAPQVAIAAYEKDFTAMSTELGMEIAGIISLSELSSSKVYYDIKGSILHF